jgi:hypothetical protein
VIRWGLYWLMFVVIRARYRRHYARQHFIESLDDHWIDIVTRCRSCTAYHDKLDRIDPRATRTPWLAKLRRGPAQPLPRARIVNRST